MNSICYNYIFWRMFIMYKNGDSLKVIITSTLEDINNVQSLSSKLDG